MSKKAAPMTPKAISNRIKAKGLQKLRWYCEMCQKQCRDENGFKCHAMSESHQRQLLLFAETPDKYIEQYSQEFLKGYTDLLKRQFGCKRVLANTVYQEYIKDRNHVHMNSTKWHTLSGLIQWLGKQGICKVDETERGWYLQYVEHDPEQERRQRGKERLELTDAEIQQRQIERQIEWGLSHIAEEEDGEEEETAAPTPAGPTELKRDGGDGGEGAPPIRINLALKRQAPVAKAAPVALAANALARAEREAKQARMSQQQQQRQAKSAVEELREELEREKAGRTWLSPGLVVRVQAPGHPELHRRKAAVESVSRVGSGGGGSVGRLRFLDEGRCGRAEVPEPQLETVLPALGGAVRVVGPSQLHRGCLAELVSLEEARYSCTVRLVEGPSAGVVVPQLPYEDVCKVSSS